MPDLYHHYNQYLAESRTANTFRDLISIDRLCPDHEMSSRFIKVNDQHYINFSSNDYLALSTHPLLIQRSTEWVQKYGVGSGASRLVTGNSSHFHKIEKKIAKLKNKESALIFGAGFQANATIIQALLDVKILKQKPLVFSDRLNHASIHFGCAAAHITQIRYQHCNIEHLKTLLEKYKNSQQPKFIITETIFSMDGDQAPLADIKKLATEFNAFLIIDDAHSIQCSANKSIIAQADLIIGTFSKAFGSFGSYAAGKTELMSYLKNRCSGFIYSTALPPPILGAIDAAADLIPKLDTNRKHLKNLSTLLRKELNLMNIDTAQSSSHIIPLILKDPKRTLELSKKLKENHLWTTAIRYPTVPKNTDRIRISLSSALKETDIEKLLSALK